MIDSVSQRCYDNWLFSTVFVQGALYIRKMITFAIAWTRWYHRQHVNTLQSSDSLNQDIKLEILQQQELREIKHEDIENNILHAHAHIMIQFESIAKIAQD